MKVIFASGVLEEASEAEAYYESKVDGLGEAFSSVLRSSIQGIKRYPHRSRLFSREYRRFIVDRFPYGIIYRIEGDIIYILAIAHFKRRPFYWEGR